MKGLSVPRRMSAKAEVKVRSKYEVSVGDWMRIIATSSCYR